MFTSQLHSMEGLAQGIYDSALDLWRDPASSLAMATFYKNKVGLLSMEEGKKKLVGRQYKRCDICFKGLFKRN